MSKWSAGVVALWIAVPLGAMAAGDAPSRSPAANGSPAMSECGSCKMQRMGGTTDATSAPADRAQSNSTMKGSGSTADRPPCKQRDTNCRLNELQRDNELLEQRLNMMQKRMDEMGRRGDGNQNAADGPPHAESAPKPESEQHHH